MALHSGHRGYSFAFQHDGTNKGERGKRAEFGSDENTGVFGGEGKVEGFENGGRSDGLFALRSWGFGGVDIIGDDIARVRICVFG